MKGIFRTVTIIIAVMTMAIIGTCVSVAADSITYVDEGGASQTCSDYEVVTGDNFTWGETGKTKWYVLSSSMTVTARYTVAGDVHLILTDGCTLNVTAETDKAGICVSGEGNSLTVYGQSKGTGTISATGKGLGAGIGGGKDQDGQNITINGGTVIAKGGAAGDYAGAAGIGGGNHADGSDITINGGNVTAEGNGGSAGIGGGCAINDTARADYCAGGSGSNITITGGKVTARGDAFAAGIGGGRSGSASNITIKGGKVIAEGDDSGIGRGFNGSSVSSIKISAELLVKAGENSSNAEIIDNDGNDLSSDLEELAYVYVTPCHNVIFNMMGHGIDVASQKIESDSKMTEPDDPEEEGYVFCGWYKEEACQNKWDFSADTVSQETTLYAKWVRDIADAEVTGVSDAAYAGKEITPDPVVSLNGSTLTKDTDYSVEYENNTNAGKASVKITGTGSYGGNKTVEFNITKATVTVTPESGQSKVYGDADLELKYTSEGTIEGEEAAFAGSLSREKGEDVKDGGYKIEIGSLQLINKEGNFIAGNYDLKISSTPVMFNITKRYVTLTSESDTMVYDGTELTNETVLVGGAGFAEGEGASYDVTGSQREVGSSENTFTYTLKDGTKEGNYNIETSNGTLEVTEKTGGEGDSPDYLTFTAEADSGNSITLNYDSADYVRYRINGNKWQTCVQGKKIEMSKGDRVAFRGKNVKTDDEKSFVITGGVTVSGSITSIKDGYGGNTQEELTDEYCYAYMFQDSTGLLNAPELPATTLSEGCYCGMFEGCASLKTAPELPATKMTDYCYEEMFYGCESLTSAPELPATDLAEACYYEMFEECTSLKTAPELPATKMTDYCYGYMFYGCTNLKIAPELPATKMTDYCYEEMFYGCESLASAPELPATDLAEACYYEMFEECTSLKTAPELPATDLAEACYKGMFYGCESLTSAPKLPAKTLTADCYEDMFEECSSLKTAPELPATDLAEDCYCYMFYDCESLTSAPELPATSLADYCYYGMFCGCSNIKLSDTKVSGEYEYEWTIPEASEEGNDPSDWNCWMFDETGGTFTDDPERGRTYYQAAVTVAFCTSGGSDVTTQIIMPDGSQKATKPDDPTREGCKFTGWYTETGCTNKWDFEQDVTQSLTLYAGWIIDIQNATFGTIENQTYTGAEIKPEPSVTYENQKLTKDVDYTLDYQDNIKAGTASIIINGIGTFEGSKTLTFTIKKKQLSISTDEGKKTTVDGKAYDGTVSAAVTPGTLKGAADGDDVQITASGEFNKKNTGEEKEVKVTYSLSGADADNYIAPKSETLTADISPRTLTVKDTTAEDKVYDGNETATVTAGTLENLVEGDEVEIDTATGTYADKNAGEDKEVTVSYILKGADSSNYTVSDRIVTASIDPKEVVLEWSHVNDLVYNGKNQKPTVNVKADSLIGDDTCTVTITGEQKNAGTDYVATASELSNSNYCLPEEKTKEFSIAKKQLSISTEAGKKTTVSNKTYDGNTNAVVTAGALENLVEGDEVEIDTATGTYADKNAGEGKEVTVSYTLKGADSSNYTVSDGTVSASIDPKEVALEWSHVNDLVYNGKNQKPEAKAAGLVGDDTCTVTVTGEATNAGEHTATASELSNSNYCLPEEKTKKFSIAKKKVNVAAENKESYVGSDLEGLTYEADELCSGDSWTGKLATDADKAAVGEYDILQGDLTAGDNYEISFTKGIYKVKEKEEQEIAFSGVSGGKVTKTYGDGAFAEAVTGAETEVSYGSSNTEVASVDASTGEVTIKKAGSATITATAKESYKYKSASASYELKVNKVKVDLPVAKTDLVYSGQEQTGVVLPDKAAYTLDGNVKTKAGSHTAIASLSDRYNYKWKDKSSSDDQSISWSIGRKQLSISTDEGEKTTVGNKTYDGTVPAAVTPGALKGAADGDDVQITASGEFKEKNIGEDKEVNVSYSLSGDDADNYIAPKSETLTADISPRTLTVKDTTAEDKVYDGNETAAVTAGTLENLVEGDEVEIDTATGAFADRNAGEGKEVTVSYTLKGADSSNYTVSDGTVSATISRKTVNVTAENKESYIGSDLEKLTYEADELCSGDSWKGALATAADKAEVGEYDILQGDLTAGDNYDVSFTKGTYTVKAKNITAVPAKAATCTADGNSAYWHWTDCDKYYSDEECTNEIAEGSWVIKASGHAYKTISAGNGCKYKKCSNCSHSKDFTSPSYVKSFRVTRGKKSFKAKWKKQSKKTRKKFSGYRIRYSTKSSLAGAKTVYVSKNSSAKKIRKLTSGKKYYVEICTYVKKGGKTYYSKASGKTVKTR